MNGLLEALKGKYHWFKVTWEDQKFHVEVIQGDIWVRDQMPEWVLTDPEYVTVLMKNLEMAVKHQESKRKIKA